MSSVFGWLGYREQKGIIAEAGKHMEKVVETATLLGQSVEALCNGQLDDVQQLNEKLATAEHEADILRRDIMIKLSHGLLLPPERQDLVQLVGRMDDVADQAQGASRILVIFADKPEPFEEDLLAFSELIQRAVGHLSQALDLLNQGEIDKALAACTEVEQVEEEADRLKHAVLKKLFSTDLSARQLLLMRDLIESMENTVDRAEDSADLIRMVSISQKR